MMRAGDSDNQGITLKYAETEKEAELHGGPSSR